ncbi:Actin-related protein 3B [Balamuthia mandrillaris]
MADSSSGGAASPLSAPAATAAPTAVGVGEHGSGRVGGRNVLPSGYQGNSRSYCSGKLVSGPDRQAFYLTLLLIFVPLVLFYGFVCPWYIWRSALWGCLLLLFMLWSTGVTLSSFFLVSFMDPGILPRRNFDEEDEEVSIFELLRGDKRPIPRSADDKPLKYCTTCNIFRPPRCVHCKVCDNCVERYDHHCPWVGNCVGKRNYKFFYWFVHSAAFNLLAIMVLSGLLVIVMTFDSDKDTSTRKIFHALATFPAPIAVLAALYSFFLIWSLGGLSSFHSYLSFRARTTNEDVLYSFLILLPSPSYYFLSYRLIFQMKFVRYDGASGKNPYSQGYCFNWLHTVFAPWYPRILSPTDFHLRAVSPSSSSSSTKQQQISTSCCNEDGFGNDFDLESLEEDEEDDEEEDEEELLLRELERRKAKRQQQRKEKAERSKEQEEEEQRQRTADGEAEKSEEEDDSSLFDKF